MFTSTLPKQWHLIAFKEQLYVLGLRNLNSKFTAGQKPQLHNRRSATDLLIQLYIFIIAIVVNLWDPSE